MKLKLIRNLVKENRALGELDHPDDSVINLKNASHMIVNIFMDGPKVMGKAKVLDTPSGKILALVGGLRRSAWEFHPEALVRSTKLKKGQLLKTISSLFVLTSCQNLQLPMHL